MSYHHLTREERGKLALMYRNGYGCRGIGRRLGRSASTISRELKRNQGKQKRYRAQSAQRAYEDRKRKPIPWKLVSSIQLQEYIVEKLMLCWSPEQISGRLALEHPGQPSWCVSYSSIYRWLRLGILPQAACLERKLRHAGHRHGEKRGTKIGARELKTRCRQALRRQRLGDWEVDTIVWGTPPHKVYLLNMTDRKSRYCCLAVLRNVSKDNMLRAFSFFFEGGKLPLKTMTSDRGVEFNCHREFEDKFAALFYYTRPHSPWQKPTVENQNGLIRQFFPKAIDPMELSQEHVAHVMNLLNNRPRKCLDFKTPAEVLRFS